jgi:hypothetical protein
MRRSLTTLTLAALCGLLALAAVAALAAKLTRGSHPRAVRVVAAVPTRTWPLTLSPAPDDIALAQISFHAGAVRRLSAASLRLAVRGPFGDDYMALAVPRSSAHGVVRAMVLVVNRPSPLLDPTDVRLSAIAQRSLGVAVVRTSENAFARKASAVKPALCDLPTAHGAGLASTRLAALSSRGAPLAGFTVASAVAQAYNAACGLPYTSAFKRAVTQSSAAPSPPQPPPSPSEPATTPQPAPPSEKPVGKLPGEGCTPAPGYACPG